MTYTWSSTRFSSKTFYSLFTYPILAFLFLYFAFSSTDIINIQASLFKIKATNLIAVFFFLLYLLTFKSLQFPKRLTCLTLCILACMCISTINSKNLIASAGYILFFAFNYFCYFLLTYNLFNFILSQTILKIYSLSFYCLGTYALCQLLFSLIGIVLPGVQQYIYHIARGQAFTYEPSYYALYMTPFTMYCTTKFILQKPSDRNLRELFASNLFLLASTSTGCFFSYLFFLFTFFIFKLIGALKKFRISTIRLTVKFFSTCLFLFFLLCMTNKDLIQHGFLKFFYGETSHGSITNRWVTLIEYWDVFLEHPIIGVGFGSGPFYIAHQKLSGVNQLDPMIIDNFNASNVTTELLAGLGILGGVLFLIFIYLLTDIFRTTLKISSLSEEETIILISLGVSICVMFCTLQFNQSIMRSYMWIHVGFFYGYARHLQIKHFSTGPKKISMSPPFFKISFNSKSE